MAAVLLIRCAKGIHKASFLLQYLQVEHDDGKDRKAERQQVSIQQQDADIHGVKAGERRVAAETVNAGCDQLRFVLGKINAVERRQHKKCQYRIGIAAFSFPKELDYGVFGTVYRPCVRHHSVDGPFHILTIFRTVFAVLIVSFEPISARAVFGHQLVF